MIRQANELADPPLLWVILKRREHAYRRLSHEMPIGAESCLQVLGEDAAGTCTLRRSDSMEDRGKATDRALDRLLGRKASTKKVSPKLLQPWGSRDAPPPVFVSTGASKTSAPPSSDAGGVHAHALVPVAAEANHNPYMIGCDGMPHKYKKKYNTLKKIKKT